jgi:hypothetical protein
VDTGLNQNEAELGVLVLSVGLEVLADSDGLLDQEPEVLRNGGCQAWRIISEYNRDVLCSQRTVGLQDTEDLVTSNKADLGNSIRVSQNNADLGGGQALASELPNVINDILGGGL